MAGTTTLSPYKQLQAILMPNPEIDRAAYDRLQNSTEPDDMRLRELSNTYKKLQEEGSYQKIHEFVFNTATELANNPAYEQLHIRPDEVQADFVKNAGLPAEQLSSQPTSQQQPQLTVLGGLVKGFIDQKPASIAGKAHDTASDLVGSLQEQELMKEFDDAVARGDENKINDLMKQSLDLGGQTGLLRKQLEIAVQHINALTPDQWQKYGVNRDQLLASLQQVALNKNRALERKEKKPESEKTESEKVADRREQEREVELEKQKTTALSSTDIRKKRQAYQAYMQHRVRQARAYSVFVDFQDQDYDRIFPALRELLMASYRERIARREQQERQQEQEEEEQQDETRLQTAQQAQQASQGFVRNLLSGKKGRGAQKKLADKLLHSKALDAAARAAGPLAPAAIAGLWIVRHWKLVLALVSLAIIVIVSIVVAFISILLAIFTSSTQGQPAQLGPTCTPSSTCFAALKSEGINIAGGDYALNGDPYGKIKLVYETLSYISQHPSKYFQLLKTGQNPITIYFSGSRCAGHASTDGTVMLYGFGACGTDVAKFMLIHELGHEIAFRNPGLYNKFYNEFPLPVLIFYKLPTYNCELDYGPFGPFPGECFADTLGEYVLYKTYRNTVNGLPSYFEPAFTSFPKAFAPFYNFAKDNVYNGLEF